MILEEFDINKAIGVRLFNSLRTPLETLPKGHVLNEADIILLKQFGIKTVFGAVLEKDDIDFRTALGIVAAKLSGENTAYSVNNDGICKIIANNDGILMTSIERINKFNRLDREFVLNTIAPHSFVKKGDIIAELELTAPLFSVSKLDDILLKLSGNVSLISVAALKTKKVGIVYSNYYNDNQETQHFMSILKRLVKDLSALKLDFSGEYNAVHNTKDIADITDRALRDDNDVVFVLSSQPNFYHKDFVASAIKDLTSDVFSLSSPVVGASDLIVAEKRGKRIIAIPANYASLQNSTIIEAIKLAIFANKLNVTDFSRMQTPIMESGHKLSSQEKSNLIASEHSSDIAFSSVGAVVLCAGQGKRSGRDKLMVEVNGEPLFMKAVKAALHSQASPVFVITGHRSEEVEEFLKDIDVNVIYNPEFYAGVKTSISLGLKSMPSFCDGALIVPADMPNLTKEFLDEMIMNFSASTSKQLCLALANGVKSNPVIWSKELYNVADIVPENAHMRPVFVEHSDYTKMIEAPNEDILLDVNYPADIEKVCD